MVGTGISYLRSMGNVMTEQFAAPIAKSVPRVMDAKPVNEIAVEAVEFGGGSLTASQYDYRLLLIIFFVVLSAFLLGYLIKKKIIVIGGKK